MTKPWVYKVTVPSEKSNQFIDLLHNLHPLATDEDFLEVLEEEA